jgi:hypothetical protein
MLSKLVMSALASAQQDAECDFNRLHVVDVRSDSGQIQRRWNPRSRGQMYPLLMRYSNLTVVLGERDAKVKRERGGVDRSRRARVAASRASRQPAPAEAATPAPAESDDANTTEEEA